MLTVTTGEVTTLEHEVGDDTVEGRALVAETVFTSGELTEVLGGLRDYIVVELEDDATSGLVVNADVELGALTRRTRRSSSIADDEGRQLQLRPHILGYILTKTLLMVGKETFCTKE